MSESPNTRPSPAIDLADPTSPRGPPTGELSNNLETPVWASEFDI
jgi:hypothetical protein